MMAGAVPLMAVVVDPQRDMAQYTDAARDLGVRITHVLETHIHNDYLSGGPALAQVSHGLRGWAFRHRGLSPDHAGAA